MVELVGTILLLGKSFSHFVLDVTAAVKKFEGESFYLYETGNTGSISEL